MEDDTLTVENRGLGVSIVLKGNPLIDEIDNEEIEAFTVDKLSVYVFPEI